MRGDVLLCFAGIAHSFSFKNFALCSNRICGPIGRCAMRCCQHNPVPGNRLLVRAQSRPLNLLVLPRFSLVCKGEHLQLICRCFARASEHGPFEKAMKGCVFLGEEAHHVHQQRKLTHQQHHVHPWNSATKARLPLPACRGKNVPNKCKHGFPKVPNPRCRVICRGNARKFGLSTRGRRNALGTVLGRRQDPWLSGTCRAFALMEQPQRPELSSASHSYHPRPGLCPQLPRRLHLAAAAAHHGASSSSTSQGTCRSRSLWAAKSCSRRRSS